VKNKLSVVPALILHMFVISSVSFSVFVLSSEMVFARNHELSPPILNKTSLNLFNSLGANLGNKPLTADNGLPPAVVTPSEVQVTNHGERQITFAVPIPFNTTATEIFDKYKIPTYATPSEEIAKGSIFSPPTFIVRQSVNNDTNGVSPAFFTLTPILERIFPDMTLLVNEFPTQKNAKTKVEQIKVTFAKEGRTIGFSFGISSEIPEGLQIRSPSKFNTTLFLNIDYIGEGSAQSGAKQLNFSDPTYFSSSPEVSLIVSKSLNAEKLNDGCPKMAAGLFDDDTGRWRPANLTRSEKLGSEDVCSYKLLTEHFSKFAVGGVVPPGQLGLS
jgi:hypothetical protein